MKDDKIYEMLNDAEIDLNEYEVEELSSEEKERYKTRIRMEVKRMNRETKNKKNKNMRKIYFIAQTPTEAIEYLKNYEPSTLDVDKNAIYAR